MRRKSITLSRTPPLADGWSSPCIVELPSSTDFSLLAGYSGFEPETLKLTASCSAVELITNMLAAALRSDRSLSGDISYGTGQQVLCGVYLRPIDRRRDTRNPGRTTLQRSGGWNRTNVSCKSLINSQVGSASKPNTGIKLLHARGSSVENP